MEFPHTLWIGDLCGQVGPVLSSQFIPVGTTDLQTLHIFLSPRTFFEERDVITRTANPTKQLLFSDVNDVGEEGFCSSTFGVGYGTLPGGQTVNTLGRRGFRFSFRRSKFYA